MIRKIAERLARTDYVRDALEHPPDLRDIRRNLPPGMGWPLSRRSQLHHRLARGGRLRVLAAWFREPLIVAVGGPLTYGLSHLVFLTGAWLAGAQYVRLLMKHATRRAFEKILFRNTRTSPKAGDGRNGGA